MKSYKLVNSEACRLKAESLGYKKHIHAWNILDPFLIIGSNGYYSAKEYNIFVDEIQEITQAAFLALPEPIKVGDIIKAADGDGCFFIGRVDVLDDGEFEIDSTDTSFSLSAWNCTKLTPEQIEVLGLEEDF